MNLDNLDGWINKPTKCEVLITRKCNLRCSGCAMAKDTEELSASQWAEVPTKLHQLGISFAPIYGAEPLMVFESLIRLVEECYKLDIPTSIITNGILLDERRAQILRQSGLRSITLSVDMLPMGTSETIKSNAALDKLDMCLRIFDDVEIIHTITYRDWELLPSSIAKMSKLGVWVHFDFLHGDRGQQGTKCRGSAMMPSIDRIVGVGAELIKMKRLGYLIHPSLDVLEYIVGNPDEIFNQSWKCRGASFVTLNCSGDIYFCDDNQPDELSGRFPILEYGTKWKWDEFVGVAREQVKNCPGCCWLTHLASDLWQEKGDEQWKNEMTHRIARKITKKTKEGKL